MYTQTQFKGYSLHIRNDKTTALNRNLHGAQNLFDAPFKIVQKLLRFSSRAHTPMRIVSSKLKIFR